MLSDFTTWVRLDLRDRFKYIALMNHRFEIDGSPPDTSVGGPIGRCLAIIMGGIVLLVARKQVC